MEVELEELRKAFGGEDGSKGAEEVLEAMQSLGVVISMEELAHFGLSAMPKSSFVDFVALARKVFQVYDLHEEINEAFVALRVPCDFENQRITAESLYQSGIPLTMKQCERLIVLLGNEGSISWESFHGQMQKNALEQQEEKKD